MQDFSQKKFESTLSLYAAVRCIYFSQNLKTSFEMGQTNQRKGYLLGLSRHWSNIIEQKVFTNSIHRKCLPFFFFNSSQLK